MSGSANTFNPMDHVDVKEVVEAVASPGEKGMNDLRTKLRKKRAAHLATTYGLPEGMSDEDIFAEHHRRRCEAHGLPLTTTAEEIYVMDNYAFFAQRRPGIGPFTVPASRLAALAGQAALPKQ